MGLQESSEQIPGQCIQKGEGGLDGCVPPSVDRLVGSVVRKTPAGLSGGTVNERLMQESQLNLREICLPEPHASCLIWIEIILQLQVLLQGHFVMLQRVVMVVAASS